jgi:Co/Zn/Cd efflux system component
MMPTSHNNSNLDKQTFSCLYVNPVTMQRSFNLSLQTRLLIIIAISTSFFVIELAVGFCTHSLALIADAFHYIGDVLGFVVGWWVLRVSSHHFPSLGCLSRTKSIKDLKLHVGACD